MIQDALQATAGSLEGLADEVGVSYASLRAWADGRRNPTSENVRSLISALERRGGQLTDLASELKRHALREISLDVDDDVVTFAIRTTGQAQGVDRIPRGLLPEREFLSGRGRTRRSALESPASRGQISDYSHDELRALWRTHIRDQVRRESGEP